METESTETVSHILGSGGGGCCGYRFAFAVPVFAAIAIAIVGFFDGCRLRFSGGGTRDIAETQMAHEFDMFRQIVQEQGPNRDFGAEQL
jgi:hypothetical protein